MSKYTDSEYVQQAKRDNYSEDLEICNDEEVSQGDDDGAWVKAWVWVRDSDIEAHREKQNDDSSS